MRFTFAVHGWRLGGIATFCRNLAGGLRERGHAVALVVSPETKGGGELPSGVFEQCRVLPRELRLLRSQVQRVSRAIDQLQPDCLILNDSPYAMAALPFLRSSTLRVAVIHSSEADEVELGLSQPDWCDQVLVVSESVKKTVMDAGSGSRVAVCPLGVPVPKLERPQRGLDGPIEVICVGRVVVHQKRMDRIPAIARLLAEWGVAFHWRVLGEGEFLPALRGAIAKAGFGGRFDFQGRVSPTAVVQALSTSDVLVLPSDCEGMPQVLLEAMAQGVVPVASRLPGATVPLVEEGKSGFLCDPSQAEEFALAIASLAGNRERCTEMGRRAAGLIARDFTQDALTERFLQRVAEVARQKRGRPAPLPSSAWQQRPPSLRCLGLWRSWRHQTLGRLKRWLI